MSQISKATQSSESDTDFIQDNTINSVYGDSLGSENDTPAKAKRGLNKILSVGRSVYRRPANDQHDQHEYVCVKRGCPVRMRLILEVESERCYIMATTNIEHDHSKCTRKKNNKSQRHRIHRIHRPLLNLTNRMI
jgi:hypothetical protein